MCGQAAVPAVRPTKRMRLRLLEPLEHGMRSAPAGVRPFTPPCPPCETASLLPHAPPDSPSLRSDRSGPAPLCPSLPGEARHSSRTPQHIHPTPTLERMNQEGTPAPQSQHKKGRTRYSLVHCSQQLYFLERSATHCSQEHMHGCLHRNPRKHPSNVGLVDVLVSRTPPGSRAYPLRRRRLRRPTSRPLMALHVGGEGRHTALIKRTCGRKDEGLKKNGRPAPAERCRAKLDAGTHAVRRGFPL